MSAKVIGKEAFKELLASLPAKMEANVLRGGLRAFAVEVAEEAKTLCHDPLVKGSIKVTSRAEPGLVSAKVKTVGKGAFRAPWGEYGTDPHFISVDSGQSEGKTVRRINRDHRPASLMINGKFVGETVFHPGARPHPFMRPAFDHKRGDATATIGAYVRDRMTKEGLAAPADQGNEE